MLRQSWFRQCSVTHRLRNLSSESNTHSLVGPPDSVSSIRPIKHRQPFSHAEERVQELEKRVWQYNHDFWTKHNTQFKIQKEKFSRISLEGGSGKLTAQELSAFYKTFLDDKHNDYINYSRGWLKLQSRLTWSLLKLNLNQMSEVFKTNNNKR